MEQLEKEIETKLRDKVKSLGGRAYKFVSPRQFSGYLTGLLFFQEEKWDLQK